MQNQSITHLDGKQIFKTFFVYRIISMSIISNAPTPPSEFPR